MVPAMLAAYPSKHLTTLDEWHKMGEANIYPPNSRLELINGEILDMAPIGSRHASHLNRIVDILVFLCHGKTIPSPQNPLQLGDLSEAQPDFMLLKPSHDYYLHHLPTADDVLLLVEIADSSLKFDQNEKLRLYALHGILEYWIVNVNNACLEVYRKPQGDTYTEKIILVKGDTITLSQLPNLNIKIADIL
jgi:Uma2 family endonuclease